MKRSDFYRQCTLSRGTGRTIGYIEERGAIVGAQVELAEDDKNLWTVESVGDKRLAMTDLQFMHKANHHASIDG